MKDYESPDAFELTSEEDITFTVTSWRKIDGMDIVGRNASGSEVLRVSLGNPSACTLAMAILRLYHDFHLRDSE